MSNTNGILYKKSDVVTGPGTMYGINYKGDKFKCNTLDNLLKELNIKKVYFMKIDVEGHEPEVLLGAKNILKNTDHLYIEVWSDQHYEKRSHNKNVKYNKKILDNLSDFYPIQKIEKNYYFKNIRLL